MTPAIDQAAYNMIRNASLKATPTDVRLLAEDITAVIDEDPDAESDSEWVIDTAVDTLQQRLGGLRNLESYLKCLRVGSERRAVHAGRS